MLSTYISPYTPFSPSTAALYPRAPALHLFRRAGYRAKEKLNRQNKDVGNGDVVGAGGHGEMSYYFFTFR